MAHPFHQTRLLLRQRLLTALGIAGAAAALGCEAEAHTPTPAAGGTTAAQSSGGSTGSSGERTDEPGTSGGPDAASGHTDGSGDRTGSPGGGSSAMSLPPPDAEPVDAGPADAAATDAAPADAAPTGAEGVGEAAVGEAGTEDAKATDAAVMSELPECIGSRLDPFELCWDRAGMETMFRVGTGQLRKDPVPTDAEVQAAFLDDGCLPKEHVADSCCNPAETDGVPQGNGLCCYYVCIPSACCGRPFVVDGEARLAPLVARADWAGEDDHGASRPADIRAAALWLEDARMEHASIAAFARFTQQLLALGAPAELLAEATRAAADEVRHARLCFALAAHYGLSQRGPGALPEATGHVSTDRHEVCIETFVEGCIGETVAAHLATAQASLTRDARVRAALREIAHDEARHSELAWRFVQWVATQDPSVLQRLETELAGAIAEAARSSVEEESPEALARLHAAGRLSAHEQRLELRGVLRDVVRPCLDALGAQIAEGAVA